MTKLVGQTLGGYAVLEQLGTGGMGAVFKAKQPVLDRVVALKVIAPQVAQDPSFVARFQHEAKSAARLNHPNIVQVYAAGEETGTHFMISEFVEGESLHERLCREGRMDPQEALAICVFVAEGLKYAWDEARIIHRDIKPANIFLSNKGAVKVGDLGLAKGVGSEASAALTQSGTTVGTPFYCSPEQAQAEKEIDFRADIYSLGCTLYHMLSGKKPYESGQEQSPISVMVKQIHDLPPAILQVLPTCPMPVVMLLGRMLKKNPSERHQSYEELIEEMRRVHDMLDQPQPIVPASSPSAGATIRKEVPTLTYGAAAGAVALLLAGLFIWAPWKDRSAGILPAQPRVAVEQRKQDAARATPPAVDQVSNQKEEPKPPVARQSMVETVPARPPETKPVAVADIAKPDVPVTPPATMVAATVPVEEKVAAPIPKTEDTFVKDVVGLPPEQQVTRVVSKLKELNPGFDGKETHKIESGAVTELGISTVGVTDISPLKALKWMKKLTLTPWTANQKGALTDLAPLQGLPLTWLWCHNNPITDLTPLREMPLTVLSCGGTQVRNLAPLAGMKLTVLSFNDTEVNDLSPLQDMLLTVLWCNNTKVTDLAPLQAMPLQELRCDFVPARDAAILRNIPTLAKINDTAAKTFWTRVGPTANQLPPTSAATSGLQKTMTTSNGIELVWIPPGEFMLGSTAEERAGAENEGNQPRRTIIRLGFWMGRTETTVGQWKRFVDATNYKTDADKKGQVDHAVQGKGLLFAPLKGGSWRDPGFGFKLKDNHPVSCVSWGDAMAFCEWLTETEKKSGKLPTGMVYRLPTESEWEYACLAGMPTKFWWGNSEYDAERHCNLATKTDGSEFISVVDDFGPRGRNKFGLADMAGNVREWVLDAYDPAGAHAELFADGPARLLRGGGFDSRASFARCACRDSYGRASVSCVNGFRLCCGVPEGSGQVAGASRTGPATAKLSQPSATTQEPLAGSGKVIVVEGRDLDAGFAFTNTSAPYEIRGTLAVPTKQDSHLREAQLITIAAGVEIRGGTIDMGRRGQISIEGGTDKPAVFHSVTFAQNLNDHGFKARNAVFDRCTFVKTGGWFSYSSSKWELDSCLLYKCVFPRLPGKDYGLKFSHSAFVGMNFPELEHRRKKGEPFDHMDHLRTKWNKIVRCQFVDCEIPPTLVWCAEESNHFGCRFVTGEAFESRTKTMVTAFVADTVGKAPDAATRIAPTVKVSLAFNYVRQPFSTYLPGKTCPLADITRDTKIMNWLSSRPASLFTILTGTKTPAGTRTEP